MASVIRRNLLCCESHNWSNYETDRQKNSQIACSKVALRGNSQHFVSPDIRDVHGKDDQVARDMRCEQSLPGQEAKMLMKSATKPIATGNAM